MSTIVAQVIWQRNKLATSTTFSPALPQSHVVLVRLECDRLVVYLRSMFIADTELTDTISPQIILKYLHVASIGMISEKKTDEIYQQFIHCISPVVQSLVSNIIAVAPLLQLKS